MNGSLFVLDPYFQKYSHWEKADSSYELYLNNRDNIYRNKTTTVSPVEFLLATSLYGPLYLENKYKWDLMLPLLQGLSRFLIHKKFYLYIHIYLEEAIIIHCLKSRQLVISWI